MPSRIKQRNFSCLKITAAALTLVVHDLSYNSAVILLHYYCRLQGCTKASRTIMEPEGSCRIGSKQWQLTWGNPYETFFSAKIYFFPTADFLPIFFLMKMAGFRKIVCVSCVVDFDDMQVWLRQFCLNLKDFKIMTIFFKLWPSNIKKTVITVQALRFKQSSDCLGQTWISSKLIMQLTHIRFFQILPPLWRKSG